MMGLVVLRQGLAIALIVTLTGCGGSSGPPLGNVSGKILLDGQPLVNGKVGFTPVEGGRSSLGITDETGFYKLEYTPDLAGATVGEHEVRIHSAEIPAESSKDPLLPANYNTETELRASVKPGSNVIDFSLKKDGSN